MRENTPSTEYSEYGHLLPSVYVSEKIELIKIKVQDIVKALNFGTFHRFSSYLHLIILKTFQGKLYHIVFIFHKVIWN